MSSGRSTTTEGALAALVETNVALTKTRGRGIVLFGGRDKTEVGGDNDDWFGGRDKTEVGGDNDDWARGSMFYVVFSVCYVTF